MSCRMKIDRKAWEAHSAALSQKRKRNATPAATELQRQQAKARREYLEATLAQQMDGYGIGYMREFRFHDTRQWRIDFLIWPAPKIAVEVDGGTYTQGRHTRGAGYAEDCRKLNAAALAGYAVLRFDADMVKSGEAINTILRALGRETEVVK